MNTLETEATNKARELILFMDNDQDIYNRFKQPWVNNYTKKVKKGIFNIEDGIKGMSYLMNNLVKEYNKEFGIDKDGIIPESYIKLHKDEKRTVQIELLRSVLLNIYDNDYDNSLQVRDQVTELLKLLKGFY